MNILKEGKAYKGDPAKIKGSPPAVLLFNPKFPHNVGMALRACSCYGVEQLWYTGTRVSMIATETYRLPREERLKGYKEVLVHQYDRPFDQFKNVVPVAVELVPNCESLPQFEHPENALYVFGPEDGSLPSVVLRHCQRFVSIPTRHCLNLSASVYTVLYDRQTKLNPELTIYDTMKEDRGHVA